MNSNCDLAICDFGLARGVNAEYQDTLTEYVVTRWYRAPELLTDSCHYGSAVDMWSVGCIFAEILTRKPLFQGRDYMHQLQVIIELLGTPTEQDLSFITNDSAKQTIKTFSRRRKRQFKKPFTGCNPVALDLLEKMLVFDPSRRCSIDVSHFRYINKRLCTMQSSGGARPRISARPARRKRRAGCTNNVRLRLRRRLPRRDAQGCVTKTLFPRYALFPSRGAAGCKSTEW